LSYFTKIANTEFWFKRDNYDDLFYVQTSIDMHFFNWPLNFHFSAKNIKTKVVCNNKEHMSFHRHRLHEVKNVLRH